MLALARENARKAGVANVEFHKGYIEADPAPRRERRRGYLELRDQPLGRQAEGAARGRTRAAAWRTLRRLRRDRRRGHGRCDPRRHAGIHRLHRRSAHPPTSSHGRSPTPASATSRYARRTASTHRQPRRSFARASRSRLRPRRPDTQVEDHRRAARHPLSSGSFGFSAPRCSLECMDDDREHDRGQRATAITAARPAPAWSTRLRPRCGPLAVPQPRALVARLQRPRAAARRGRARAAARAREVLRDLHDQPRRVLHGARRRPARPDRRGRREPRARTAGPRRRRSR